MHASFMLTHHGNYGYIVFQWSGMRTFYCMNFMTCQGKTKTKHNFSHFMYSKHTNLKKANNVLLNFFSQQKSNNSLTFGIWQEVNCAKSK